MLEQTNINTRLKIEDDLAAALSGDNLKYALAYVAYMKENGLARDTGDGNAFNSADGYVCQICINPSGYWYAWSVCMGGWDSIPYHREYQNFPIDERVKEYAWEHVRICSNFADKWKCGCGFQPGKRITLFGKEFYHTCHGGVEFGDLDDETLELAKKLTDVWAQIMADAAKNDKPNTPKENEWFSVKENSAHASRSLGKIYTKSLDLQFYITHRSRYASNAAVGFSGGGWVPAAMEQIPVALRFGDSSWFVAYKGPAEGWKATEKLKYQANVPYFVEMSINITDNTYNAIIWMLDADGKPDTPYLIAKDFPFRHGDDTPTITAIDTIYLGPAGWGSYIIRDFKIVGGE